MKLWEVFRFEVGYQSRSAWTWAYFVALFAVSFQMAIETYTESALEAGYFYNAPFVIASVTTLASVMALLVAAALAGDAGARDVQTRMDPLVYTSPVGKGAYLGGRFLAAFALNALILLSVQIALLVSAIMPRLAPELLGPFQPGAYLSAYLLIALPNAFVATALLFSIAALSRRASASYLGAVLLFFMAEFVYLLVAGKLGHWELAKMLDPIGLTVISEISRTTTASAKNTLSLAHNASLSWNRILWVGIALAVLGFTHFRFRFEHAKARGWFRHRVIANRIPALSELRIVDSTRSGPIVVPRVKRTFRFPTHARQTLAIVAQSFRHIALSWGGLVLAGLTAIMVLFGPQAMRHLGLPLVPTTQQMTAWVGHTGEILWTIVPLLTVFYVGELVWRERERGLSEISDATPAPEWVRLLGKFLGLSLVLLAYQVLMLLGCMLVQVQLGYFDFEIGLYARILLGLVVVEHLLFVVVAFAVHVLVNQKYIGYLVLLIAYAFTFSASSFGVEHNLLVYGADPGWQYSDMRAFGPFIAPWMWFNLYWAAWALLLAVASKLFWVRGTERSFASRLQVARHRLTPPTIGVAAASVALIVTLGSFIFYNTNVLNAYETASDRTDDRAEYERRYGRYEGIPQARLVGASLRVEIYPDRREVDIRGTYLLVNMSGVAIDSIHLAPDSEVETGSAELDRPATLVLDDPKLHHRIYALGAALQPGDSARLNFALRFKPRGFTNSGVDPSVAGSATFFDGNDWLPALGYQSDRELTGAGARRVHGLPPRAVVRSLDDVAARSDMTGAGRIIIETVVGTAANQIAVAPGALRGTWTEDGRRYFHYATDVPIRNDFAIFSAAYAVRDERWKDVSIQILHDPRHSQNVDRMARSIVASLSYFTRHFGPYPHGQIRLVERPGQGNSLHAYPVNVSYEEEFSLFKPYDDSLDIDFPFAVVAHEVAHGWWGNQLTPADVEGAPLLTESLAWYSALSVVQETYGDAHLGRLLSMMREAYLSPRLRAGIPLLRAYDRFTAYRRGPSAMYALREYVGADRINLALKRLLERHGAGAAPLATSLDLYHELQGVTPDSLRYLLVDLFEANTFWDFKAKGVTAEALDGGRWRVTLELSARKEVVDTKGVPKEIPMNDLVEVGVFAATKDGGLGEPLYSRLHRIRSGDQRITLTVPGKPAWAGIDPRNILIDLKVKDNVRKTSS